MHRIGFVIFQGANIMCTAPVSLIEMANETLGKSFYDVRILSDNGGPVRTSVGITIETEAFGEPDFDTLLIGAGTEIEPPAPKLLDFMEGAGVRRMRRTGSSRELPRTACERAERAQQPARSSSFLRSFPAHSQRTM